MQAILPLLANPTVGVLGLTVVTGDGWENEEAARLLRFLEIAGRARHPGRQRRHLSAAALACPR